MVKNKKLLLKSPKYFNNNPNDLIVGLNNIKTNTTKQYHCETIENFKKNLYYYQINYNFNLKLKILKYKTPFEEIENYDLKSPKYFNNNLNNLIVGLNNQGFVTVNFE